MPQFYRKQRYFIQRVYDDLLGFIGKLSEIYKKDENIKFKYIEGGVEDIITNSDHAMVKLLKFSGLCNIGSCWFRGEYKMQKPGVK